jgi:hypothetical protein
MKDKSLQETRRKSEIQLCNDWKVDLDQESIPVKETDIIIVLEISIQQRNT